MIHWYFSVKALSDLFNRIKCFNLLATVLLLMLSAPGFSQCPTTNPFNLTVSNPNPAPGETVTLNVFYNGQPTTTFLSYGVYRNNVLIKSCGRSPLGGPVSGDCSDSAPWPGSFQASAQTEGTYYISGTIPCPNTNSIFPPYLPQFTTIPTNTVTITVAKPVITDFSPKSGPVGTVVTINGNNFSSSLANNTVFFGTIKANVLSATNTQLTVAVPSGAGYDKITVNSAGYISQSNLAFDVTFNNGCISPTSLNPKVDFVTNASPAHVASGDLDGDGNVDLVVVNGGNNTISVFRNTNGGSFVNFASRVDFTTGTSPNFVSIGDLDGDGKAELVVCNGVSNTVSVFRNTGSGAGNISFSTKVDFTTGARPSAVAIGDFDGDGKPDLAIGNFYSFSASILRNTSSGTGNINFATKVDFTTGTNINSVAAGDIDGDGKPDLAVVNTSGNTVSIFRNASGGSGSIAFDTKVDFTTGSNPYFVTIGDLDQDGKQDLVVTNTGSGISIFKNTSSGAGTISYAGKIDFTTGSNPKYVSIADLDGDGKPDLTVVNQDQLLVFRNTGSAAGDISYAAPVNYSTGGSPYSAATGDFNSDGKPDLAATIFNNTLTVLASPVIPNATLVAMPATLNGCTQSSIPVGLAGCGAPFSITYSNGITSTTVNNIATPVYNIPAIVVNGTSTTYTLQRVSDANGPVAIFGNPTVTVTRPCVTIIDFSPKSGDAGSPVTITGHDFSTIAGNNQVYFGNVQATVLTATANRLLVVVPGGASTGKIKVISNTYSSVSESDFTVVPYVPFVYPAGSPVAINGKLKVTGTQLSNECGKPVQLKGMSSHGLQWFGNCNNSSSLDALVNDWKADVFRLAMYVGEGGYLTNPEGWKTAIDNYVDLCGSKGIYCIIDWHVLTPGDPNANIAEARDFWSYMSAKHRNKKHVLYEICNEPNGVGWSSVKTYANDIIPRIRANDPSTVILVGTPTWSQDVDIASFDKLAFNNLMYSLHFYTGTHTQYLRDKANTALNNGAPIFCSEWGTSSASGDGGPYIAEAENWMTWMDSKKISWCNWSFADKNETSAALLSGACGSSSWNNTSPSGTYVKSKMAGLRNQYFSTASITGTQVICKGQTADLSIAFTGTPPWSAVYTDGVTNTALTGITSSPYTFTVSPGEREIVNYSLISTSDAIGCLGIILNRNAEVGVNPLPPAPMVTHVTYFQGETAVQLIAADTSDRATAPPAVGADQNSDGTGEAVKVPDLPAKKATLPMNWYGTNATGGTADHNAPVPLTSTVGTTSYYVSETIGGCESPRSKLDVTVKPLPSITVNSPASVCIGIPFEMTYSVSDNFYPGNNFTIVLSDSAGSFVNSSAIGAIFSTGSGKMNVTIPEGTLDGNKYRIYLLSSNPAVAGSDNGTDITISHPVNPAVSVSAGSSNSICPGSTLTFTANPLNGGSAPQYQWKKNSINVGENSATYSDNTLNNKDTIAVVMTSNAACVASAAVQSESKVISTIPPITISNPGSAVFTSGSMIPIQWSGGCSDWNLNISLIDMSTFASYSLVAGNTPNDGNENWVIPSSVPGGDYQIYIEEAGRNTWAFSSTFRINFQPSDPSDIAVCTGSNVVFSTKYPPAGSTFQWQVSTNGGATFSNLVNNTIYQNVTTASLMVKNVQPGYNNYKYRCILTLNGTAYISNPATLTINSPKITTQPIAKTICEGASATFSVAATGADLSYQWKESLDGGVTFNDLYEGGIYRNVNTSALSVTGVTVPVDKIFKCTILSGLCHTSVTTNAVALKLNTLTTVVSNPSDISTCAATNISLTASGAGTNVSYQWQVSTNNGVSFANITDNTIYSNSKTGTLLITNIPVTYNNYKYRCLIKGTCNTVYSAVALVSVTSPGITTQPVGKTVCDGASATFAVAATGLNLTYQWQESADGGNTFYDLSEGGLYSNVTTASLTVTGKVTAIHKLYRCVVSGACADVAISNVVALIVNPATTLVANPSNVNTCAFNNVSLTASGAGANLTYQWQLSTNNGVNFANITDNTVYSNSKTGTLTIKNIPLTYNNYRYRCFIKGTCNSVYTSSALVSVTSPRITSQPVAKTICEGASALFSVNASGADLTYQWQQSTDNGITYTDLVNGGAFSNVNSATMSITAATSVLNSTYYRCVVTGSCTPAAISNGVLLKVNQVTNITTQPLGQTVCVNGTTGFNVVANGTALTYKWQVSASGTTYTNITEGGIYSNASGAALTITGATADMNNYRYRCVVGGACMGKTSTSGILTVNTACTARAALSENSGIQSYEAFPNPFADDINIVCEGMNGNVQVYVKNVQGETVFTKRNHNPEEVLTIGSDFTAGMYLVELINSSYSKVIKVIKID
jgi:hypothetical protein